MLGPDAKQVLHYAKEHDGKAGFYDLREKFCWPYDKAKSACAMLVDSGHASWTHSATLPGSTEMLSGISLSEKGRYSKRFFWGEIGSFLLKSVAVPIFVAFVTALITAIITVKVSG